MDRKIIVGAQHIACITGGEGGTALRIPTPTETLRTHGTKEYHSSINYTLCVHGARMVIYNT